MPPAFISRVRNVAVLEMAGCMLLSVNLLRQQIHFVGKAALGLSGDVGRRGFFEDALLQSADDRFVILHCRTLMHKCVGNCSRRWQDNTLFTSMCM